MSTGGSSTTPKKGKDKGKQSSSVRTVLNSAQDFGPPGTPAPSDQRWTGMQQDRDLLKQRIAQLLKKNAGGADELEKTRAALEQGADADPGKAIKKFGSLRKRVTNAESWQKHAKKLGQAKADIQTLEKTAAGPAATLKKRFEALEEQSKDDAKTAWSSMQTLIQDLDAYLQWEKLGGRRDQAIDDMLKIVDRTEAKKLNSRMVKLEDLGRKDPRHASQLLPGVEQEIRLELSKDCDEYRKYKTLHPKNLEERDRIVQHYASDPSPPKEATDVQKEVALLDGFAAAGDWAKALQSIADADALLPAIWKLEGQQAAQVVQKVINKHAKKKDARDELLSQLASNPRVLHELGGAREGREILDDLVKDIGPQATSKADKDFIKAALSARCGLKQLDGDLTTKALPRLYKILKDLPVAHTHDNPWLKNVRRFKGGKAEYSYYHPGKDAVILSIEPKSVLIRKEQDHKKGSDMTRKSLVDFNQTTLHEIGHAVDQNASYMDKHGSANDHGAWENHTIEEVADVVGGDTKFKFYSTYTGAPHSLDKAWLKKLLVMALSGKSANIPTAEAADPKTLAADPAVVAAVALRTKLVADKPNNPDEAKNEKLTDAYTHRVKAEIKKAVAKSKKADEPTKDLLRQIIRRLFDEDQTALDKIIGDVLKENKLSNANVTDWDSLLNHKALKWCRAVRMPNSSTGLWDKHDGALKLQLSDNRIYQESYEGTWTSYLGASRAEGLSSYQFRAAGEWFAESYASFFMDALKPAHPIYKWLKAEKKKDKQN